MIAVRRARRIAVVAIAVAGTLWPAAGLVAQVAGDSARPSAMSQSIDVLIARLPGRPVTLAALVNIGLREAFAAQLANADRRVADGAAVYEARALDPELRLRSDLTGASRAAGIATTTTRVSAIGVAGALPWGTTLSADYTLAGAFASSGVSSRTGPSRLSLAVSQPLLEGANQRTVAWRAALVERTAAGQQLSRTREEIAAGFELQYWLLAEAQAVEAVYGRSLELAQEILSRNVELASRDLIATVDVLTVRSGVSLREAYYTQARQSRYDQSDALLFAVYGAKAAALVQADTLPALAITEVAPSYDIPPLADAITLALANRKDLRAARAHRDASQLRAAQSRNALLPSLALDAGWSSAASGATSASIATTPSSAWRLGVSMGAPMLNRGDRGLSLLARTALDVESIRLSSREAQVTSEVRTAVRAITLGSQRWRSAANAASLAWEQLAAERRRLELGLGDSFRLLQTEENAVQAQLEAVRARYDLARASARFRLAIGQAPIAP
ncbi:TolC family protein [Gemmatimonas sp.]|uniref:TolC family protein n=1 Tax=Gemmatimonas sp. TaxID=1962908 RepID=UPI00286EA665|nr:TolC family protein [Gemmatimonas sp.]